MKFALIYGPSGIGKESIARELASRNKWRVFPQHLAFDISCSVIGFGNDGFEKYQRQICLDALKTIFEAKEEGVVLTFCYVYPASNYFMEGLLDLLNKYNIESHFIRISCDLDEHINRVTNESRKNTNKIQSKEHLEGYLQRFNFSVDIEDVKTINLESTKLSIIESAIAIENEIGL